MKGSKALLVFLLISLCSSILKKRRSVVDFHSRAEEAKKGNPIKGNSKIFAPRFLKKEISKRSSRKELRFYEKTSSFEKLQKSVRLIKQSEGLELPSNSGTEQLLTGEDLSEIDFEIIPKLLFKNEVNPLPSDLNEASIVFNGKDQMTLYPSFKPELKLGETLCSSARFTKSLDKIGWDRLYIKSYQSCSPVIQMWTNGFLEGLLTSKDVFNFFDNLVAMDSFSDPKILENLNKFFETVEGHIRRKITNEKIKSYKDESLLFYTHIAFSQIQTDGMSVGINYNSKRKLSMNELFLINADGQVPEFSVLFKDYPFPKQGKQRFMHSEEEINKFDMKRLFKRFNTSNIETLYLKLSEIGHCSVLLKLLRDSDGNIEDFLAAHSTWDEYSEMIRIFKKYEFELGGEEAKSLAIKPNDVTFSSYPGVMISTDDYYVTNKNLLVMETSLEMLV